MGGVDNTTMVDVLAGVARVVLEACFWAFHIQSRADNTMLETSPAVGRRSKAAWRGAVAVGRWQWYGMWVVVVAALVAFGVWSFLYWLQGA